MALTGTTEALPEAAVALSGAAKALPGTLLVHFGAVEAIWFVETGYVLLQRELELYGYLLPCVLYI